MRDMRRLVRGGLVLTVLTLLLVIILLRSGANPPREPSSERDRKTSSQRLDSAASKENEAGPKSREGRDPNQSSPGTRSRQSDLSPTERAIMKHWNLEDALGQKVIDLKRSQGARAALEYLNAIAWNPAKSEDERFFAIRLIAYAAAGDPAVEESALFAIRGALSRERHQLPLMAILGTLSGLRFQAVYKEEASDVEGGFLPRELDGKALNEEPAKGTSKAYTWCFRNKPEARELSVLAVHLGLASDDRLVRAAAAMAAGLTAPQESAAKLIVTATSDSDWFVRSEAVKAVSGVHTPESEKTVLLAAQQDPSDSVRAEAIRSLPRVIRDPAAAGQLIADIVAREALTSVAAKGSYTLLDLFKASGAESLVPEITKVIQSFAGRDENLLLSFLRPLGETHDPRLLPALESTASLMRSERAQQQARLALDRLRNPERYRAILKSQEELKAQMSQWEAKKTATQPPPERRKITDEITRLRAKLKELEQAYSKPLD